MTRNWNTDYAVELVRRARDEHSVNDLAGKGALTTVVTCRDRDCGRTFRGLDALQEHAESVHTFSDIEQVVREEIRERFGRRGDYSVEPPIQSIWTWVNDLAIDWVVFTVDGPGNDEKLLKCTYTIDADNNVTLGDTTEVVRRTVYDPVTA